MVSIGLLYQKMFPFLLYLLICFIFVLQGIWGVVNNAGIAGPVVPIEWLNKTDYESVFEVNTLGMVETTRIFLPLVLKSKGRIVNITSVAGRIAVLYGPYAVSKHAAEGYSDALRYDVINNCHQIA